MIFSQLKIFLTTRQKYDACNFYFLKQERSIKDRGYEICLFHFSKIFVEGLISNSSGFPLSLDHMSDIQANK